MNSERVDELIALAALGELTQAETAELDAIAGADPAVAADLSDALTTAAQLQRARAESPPPQLRSSVLDAIGTIAQERPSNSAAAEVVAIGSGRTRWRTATLAVAAAVLLVVAGAVVVSTVGDDSADDPIAAVVDADDVELRRLDGELGSLSVAYSPSQDAIVLVGDDMETLSDDATYQLWLVDDAGATSVGIFSPDDQGNVDVRFDDVDPTDFVLGVTLEPAGGSAQPSLPILASA